MTIVAAARKGARVGPYRILRPLGSGGSAAAYLARGPRGILVVLKLFAGAPDGELDAGWEREREIAARAPHGTLLSASDAGAFRRGDATCAYLVFPYVPGITLSRRMESGRLTAGHIARIAANLTDALELLHGAGVLHLDVKPDNVWLGRDGTARLLDLGSGRWLGRRTDGARQPSAASLPYAAPEQLDPEASLDGRADLFALGTTLTRALTGPARRTSPPWPWTALERLRDPASGPTRLREALGRLVEPDPARRAPTASVARELFEALVPGCAASPAWSGGARSPVGPRARVRHRILVRFDRLAPGRGAVAAVCGPAGIGTSHLVADVARTVERAGGLALRWGAQPGSPEATSAPARGLVQEALARAPRSRGLEALLPDRPDLLRTLRDPRTREVAEPDLPRAAVALIAASALQRPVLVVLEDLHFTSTAARSLLRSLLDDLASRRVLCLLTSRDRAVLRALAPLEAPIDLDPLTPEEMRTLLQQRLGSPGAAERWFPWIDRIARGVPLVAIEALRGVVPETPPPSFVASRGGQRRASPSATDLPGLLARRLDALEQVGRALLDVAACVGPAGDLRSLVELTGRAEGPARRALAALERSGLLSVKGDRWTFPHEGVLASVYARVPGPVRAEAHAAIARRLCPSLPDVRTAPLARIVSATHHLARAADSELLHTPGRALLARLVEAGEPEAASALVAAMDADGTLSDAEEDVALRWRGVAALTHAGRTTEAERLARDAVESARRTGDPTLEARSLGVLSEVIAETSRDETRRVLRRATRLARRARARDTLHRCRLALLWVERGSRDRRRAVDEGRRLLADALRCRDAQGIAMSRTTLALLLFDAGRPLAALPHAARARADGARARLWMVKLRAGMLEAALLGALRRPEAGLRVLDGIDARSRALGMVPALGRSAVLRADLLGTAGRFAAQRQEAGRARSLLREAGLRYVDAVQVEGLLGRAALGEGRIQAARRHALTGLQGIRSTQGREDRPGLLRLAAEAALDGGRLDEAARSIAALRREAGSTRLPYLDASASLLGARHALASGRRVLARARLGRVLRRTPRTGELCDLRVEATLLMARLEAAAGHSAAAVRRLRDAVALTTRSGSATLGLLPLCELARLGSVAPAAAARALRRWGGRLPAVERWVAEMRRPASVGGARSGDSPEAFRARIDTPRRHDRLLQRQRAIFEEDPPTGRPASSGTKKRPRTPIRSVDRAR